MFVGYCLPLFLPLPREDEEPLLIRAVAEGATGDVLAAPSPTIPANLRVEDDESFFLSLPLVAVVGSENLPLPATLFVSGGVILTHFLFG